MKQRRQLQRHTPLTGGQPLKRTELKRGPVKPRKPGLKSTAEKHGRAVVYARSGGLCEANCGYPATEYHHRKNRSQGGDWAPSNGMHLCSPCHQWITTHPAAARSRGWSVPRSLSPADVPAWCRGRLVWLRDDGQVIPVLGEGVA